MKETKINDSIVKILKQTGFGSECLSGFSTEQVHPDGSQRRFLRVRLENSASFMAILPSEYTGSGMAESHSAWKIGCHLETKGAPVPVMIGFDKEIGLVLCEDLGDVRLHDVVANSERQDKVQLESLYKKVITSLVRMQIQGARGFSSSWCWDSPRYDRSLMLEKESGYFLQSFCREYLKLEFDEENLAKEFAKLAENASAAPADFFLHRDFQSRNIMIKDRDIRFIDFQGGRFGPLGYDLASLLIDPYVSLSFELQEILFAYYLEKLQGFMVYGEDEFRQQYSFLAVQRNLQALGAFGFLTIKRGKAFFRDSIEPALLSLQSLLAKPDMAEYPVLRQLADKCLIKAQSLEPKP